MKTPLAMTLPVEPVPVVVIIWKCSVPLAAVWVLAAAIPAPPITVAAAAAVSAEMIILRIAGSPSGAIAARWAPREGGGLISGGNAPSVPRTSGVAHRQ